MENYKLQLRIFILFTIAIFSTFVPEYLHSFFGDWHCQGAIRGKYVPATQSNWETYELIGCHYKNIVHDPTWHWGYRHWLYLAMCLTLFIINAVSIILNAQKRN
jgi:hypothetical protein